MSTIVSAATGPWSSGTTWVGGFAPGSSDDAVIADTMVVTVTASTTVNSVTVSATSTTCQLVLNTNVKLTIKASCTFAGRATAVSSRQQLVMNPGSGFIADTTAGDVQLIFGQLSRMTMNGVSGNRITFTKTGANKFGFAQNPVQLYCMFVDGTGFVDCTGLTQDPVISWPNSLAVVDPATDVVQFDHWDFDGCGQVQMTGTLNDMPFTFTNSTIVNSIASPYSFEYSRGASTGVNATVTGNVIDGQSNIEENGITCNDNFFLGEVSTSLSAKAVSWQRNLHATPIIGGGDFIVGESDLIDCIFWNYANPQSNVHWLRWSGNFDRSVTGCVYDLLVNDDEGDTMGMPGSNPGSNTTLTWSHNLLIPTELGGTTAIGQPGPAFSACVATANCNVIGEHNTSFIGDGSGVFLGESGGDYAGQCLSLKSNIFWNRMASPAGYKINHDPSTSVTDWVSAANADYNAGYNLVAGSRGKGYNFAGTGSPGAHDVDGQDPLFVDQTRNVTQWAHSVDGSITTPAGAAALIRTANDDGVTGITPTAARTWIRAGFAPTNSAYHNTAHDGTDIGAVPFTGPSGIGVPVALFSNPI